MSARLRVKLCLGASILVAGALLIIAGWSPGASEDRFREEHGSGSGAGINLGITLGTQLLQHARKPEAPGTSTVKTTRKKDDKPKPPPKKEKPKAPPPEEKPKVEETDCVIYMQYPQDNPSEGGIASNTDIKNSAKALREKLKQDAKKDNMKTSRWRR